MLTTSLILTIGSLAGCSTTPPVVPYCTPDRPELVSLSVESQRKIKETDEQAFRTITRNDLALKQHIKLLEDIMEEHNAMYGVTCEEHSPP